MAKYKIQLNDKSYYIYAESHEDAVKKLRDAQAKRVADDIQSKDEDVEITDMALSRADAMDRCISLGKRFIEHFDKVYKEPKSQARSHWTGEMQGWLNSVRQIKLKTTNDVILDGDLRDWFFTAGANPQDFMSSPTSEELKAYDKFTTSVINGNSVVNALNSVGIKDELIQSGSEEAFKKNIATEIEAGKDPKQAAAIAYNIQRENDSKVNDMPKGVFNRYFAVSNGASETYKSREEMIKDLHTFGDDEVYVYSLKNEKDIQNLGSEDLMFVWKERRIIKKGPMMKDSSTIGDKSTADAKLVDNDSEIINAINRFKQLYPKWEKVRKEVWEKERSIRKEIKSLKEQRKNEPIIRVLGSIGYTLEKSPTDRAIEKLETEIEQLYIKNHYVMDEYYKIRSELLRLLPQDRELYNKLDSYYPYNPSKLSPLVAHLNRILKGISNKRDSAIKDETLYMIIDKDEGKYIYNVDLSSAKYLTTNDVSKAAKFNSENAKRVINELSKYTFDLKLSEYLKDSSVNDANPTSGFIRKTARNAQELKSIINSWNGENLVVEITAKGNLGWIDVYYHKTKDGYYRIPTGTAHSTTEYDLNSAKRTALRYADKFFEDKRFFDSYVKTVYKDTKSKLYIEYDLDSKVYYIASDDDKDTQVFKSLEEAKRYLERNRDNLTRILLQDWSISDEEPKNWVYVMYGSNNKEYKVENLTRVEAEHLLKNNRLLGFDGKIFENIRNNDTNNTNKMLDSDIVVARSIDDLISKIKSWNGETTTNYIYSPKSSGWYFDYFITMGHKYSYYAYIKKTAHGRHDNPNVDISRQNIDKTVTAKTAQELIDQVVRILK